MLGSVGHEKSFITLGPNSTELVEEYRITRNHVLLHTVKTGLVLLAWTRYLGAQWLSGRELD